MPADVRGPNARVKSGSWSMPILETTFEQLRVVVGPSRYFFLNFVKGFWEFAMSVFCQEIYFILTGERVIPADLRAKKWGRPVPSPTCGLEYSRYLLKYVITA